jgi:hypothetical protein
MNPYAIAGSEVKELVSKETGRTVHVVASRGMVFSPWKPSPEEVDELVKGRPVWVVLRGVNIPEFTVIVGEKNVVIPPDIRHAAARSHTLLASPRGKDMVESIARDERRVELIARLYLVGLASLGALACYGLWSIIRG